MKRVTALSGFVLALLLWLAFARAAMASSGPGQHYVVGFWQSFSDSDNSSIRLEAVSDNFDVIIIAFGRPDNSSGDTAKIRFTPDPTVESASDVIAAIGTLHSQGRKVLLSIGGSNTKVQLNTQTDLNNFVSSVASLINTYHLDGIDVDFERGADGEESLKLDPGDNDFTHPTTPRVLNLITALHTLRSMFGKAFLLTFSPSTTYVQGGFHQYGYSASENISYGAYLPVLNACRDLIYLVQPQLYDTGQKYGLDGHTYTPGTPDFAVAMGEFLLDGFQVADVNSNFFAPLPENEVSFGVLAYNTSYLGDTGYMTPADTLNAIQYLMTGRSFGGQYQLVNQAGYPYFSGVMLWNANWDQKGNQNMSGTIASYLNSIPAESGLSPSSQNAGGPAFTLTVKGSHFDASSTAIWNGRALSTTYVSETALKAAVPASLISTPGKASITVVNGSSGLTSNGKTFTILVTTLKLMGSQLSHHTDGSYSATVTLKNIGYLAAPNVTIKKATLGAAATSTTLPVGVGNMAAGSTHMASLAFPPSAGTSGSVVNLYLSGTFTGGTFAGSLRVALP